MLNINRKVSVFVALFSHLLAAQRDNFVSQWSLYVFALECIQLFYVISTFITKIVEKLGNFEHDIAHMEF